MALETTGGARWRRLRLLRRGKVISQGWPGQLSKPARQTAQGRGFWLRGRGRACGENADNSSYAVRCLLCCKGNWVAFRPVAFSRSDLVRVLSILACLHGQQGAQKRAIDASVGNAAAASSFGSAKGWAPAARHSAVLSPLQLTAAPTAQSSTLQETNSRHARSTQQTPADNR